MVDVYIHPVEIATEVGLEPSDERLISACVAATQWVAARVGADLEPALAGDTIGATTRVTCDVRWTNAARIAVKRFLRSGDAAFGVMGGMGDLAVRVAQDIPEAKLALQGARTNPDAWGIG